jgi:hypothetical protein
LTLQEISLKYIEPDFCRNAEDNGAVKKTCVWRYPSQKLSADKVYLDFDSNQRLCSWRSEKACQ